MSLSFGGGLVRDLLVFQCFLGATYVAYADYVWVIQVRVRNPLGSLGLARDTEFGATLSKLFAPLGCSGLLFWATCLSRQLVEAGHEGTSGFVSV